MSVEKSLEKLLFRIEKCLKCYRKFEDYSEKDRLRIRNWHNKGPWFFPPSEDGKAKGFFGTGEVVFMCQRPSTGGKVPDEAVILFYDLIKEHGFENAHITDLVKCRAEGGKVSEEEIRNCLPYLEEEIRILKPKLIVAVGNEAYKVLAKELKLQSIPVKRIIHYSYAVRRGKIERLKEEFKGIEEIYRNLRGE